MALAVGFSCKPKAESFKVQKNKIISPIDSEHLEQELRRCIPKMSAAEDCAAVLDLQTQEMIFEHHALAFRQKPIMVGSVIKLLATYTLLTDVNSHAENLRYNCTGKHLLDTITRPCWLHAGHGLMTLNTALMNSCNAFFYEASRRVSSSSFLATLHAFELHHAPSLSGLPIAKNILPTSLDPELLPDAFIGDFLGLQLTPAALLDVASKIALKPLSKTSLLDDNALSYIKEGMSRVSHLGTLSTVLGDAHIAAKTGTSQRETKTGTRGVIMGFLPVQNPRFAFVVVKDKGKGALDAGPIVKEMTTAAQEELRRGAA